MNSTEEQDGLIVLSKYRYKGSVDRIGTGYASIDYLLGGLGETGLTVVTGKRGSGKSTWTGQLALNLMESGRNPCFYSGELSAHMFQNWIYSQACGSQHVTITQDKFGNESYVVDEYIRSRIEAWLGNRFTLYDNSKVFRNENDAVLKRFRIAHEKYGSNLFIVDNLMTARYGIDNEKDFLRSQANFAARLCEFSLETSSPVILIAHPRKEATGYGGRKDEDINEDVSGSGDITNLATAVIQLKRASEKEQEETQADAFVTIAKNREFGRCGKIRMRFDPLSRRLTDMDNTTITKFGWEDYC